jgi:hypothetical protein
MESQTLFLGAESQAGQALAQGHYVAVHNQEARSRLFPVPQFAHEESSIAYPILRAERTPGCLCIASIQPNTFSQAHLDLTQSYVDLMSLAFEAREFYPLADIELGIMPSGDVQRSLLITFQRRVTKHMIQAVQHNQPLTRPQAELLVWQQLEEELSLLSDKTSMT